MMWPGATDKGGGQKIDSNHTSDVLSEHITVTRIHTHTALAPHKHTNPLNVRVDEVSHSPFWPWGGGTKQKSNKTAICGSDKVLTSLLSIDTKCKMYLKSKDRSICSFCKCNIC